jgi:hypothetical protein
MKIPYNPHRVTKLGDKLQESVDTLKAAIEGFQEAIKEAHTIERQSFINYEDFCIALKEHGFYLELDDFSWRHPKNGACASVEALQDVCRLFPTLAGTALKVMASGHCFNITTDVSDDGLSASVNIKSQPLLDHIATKI